MEFDTFVRHKVRQRRKLGGGGETGSRPRLGVSPGRGGPAFRPPQTPVIALVGNDACWSQISREQVALLGSNVACGLEYLGERCHPLLSPDLGTPV